MVAAPPYLLVINPNVPANSIAELIKLARAKPKALSFGSSGIGAASHLSGALFEKDAKIEMLHVPYKGHRSGGHRSAGRAHRHDVLALDHGAGADRRRQAQGARHHRRQALEILPDVPTVAEGGLPGYESVGWFGLLAPAHTPKEIVDKLNKAVVAIMATQDFKDRLAQLGAEPEPQTPDEFGRYINADVAKWSALVKEQNITIPGAGESKGPALLKARVTLKLSANRRRPLRAYTSPLDGRRASAPTTAVRWAG